MRNVNKTVYPSPQAEVYTNNEQTKEPPNIINGARGRDLCCTYFLKYSYPQYHATDRYRLCAAKGPQQENDRAQITIMMIDKKKKVIMLCDGKASTHETAYGCSLITPPLSASRKKVRQSVSSNSENPQAQSDPIFCRSLRSYRPFFVVSFG